MIFGHAINSTHVDGYFSSLQEVSGTLSCIPNFWLYYMSDLRRNPDFDVYLSAKLTNIQKRLQSWIFIGALQTKHVKHALFGL